MPVYRIAEKKVTGCSSVCGSEECVVCILVIFCSMYESRLRKPFEICYVIVTYSRCASICDSDAGVGACGLGCKQQTEAKALRTLRPHR
jgi:hypothetical protein